MKKTEHYGLNQWDLPDRVRMEDFNADNAKLESALNTLSTRISGLDGQLGSLGSQVGSLGSQVGSLGSQVGSLGSQVGTLNSQVGSLNTQVGGLDTQVGSLNTQVGGLDTQVGSLGSQIGGLNGQMGSLVTTATLESVKAALEKADTDLQNSKLEKKNIYFSGSTFVPAAGNTYALLDVSAHGLKNFFAFVLYISIAGSKSDTYYLNPYVSSGKIQTGKSISVNGSSTSGIAALHYISTSSNIFFPMGGASNIVGCVSLGKNPGLGSAECNFAQLTGFTLTPASGTMDTKASISAVIYGIK